MVKAILPTRSFSHLVQYRLSSLSEMDKEVFEVVLKNVARESKIKRIIDMKLEPALPKGENFTSDILRITVKVVLGNGRVGKKSFIAKKEISEDAVGQLTKDYDVFKNEALCYSHVFREMNYLIEEFGDTEGPLWCDLIYFSQADGIIIMEDLKALGFSTVKRTELQDLDHARLALWSLGRYHAMAKVLEERGLVSKDYLPYLLFNEPYIRIFIYGGVKALVEGMRESWGKEWTEVADKLDQMSCEEITKRIQDNGTFDDNSFKCLGHGDCWSNNMMFKHNWEGKPIEIRFIDFQFPHYNSPCIDVAFFLYSSIQPNLRRQNYNSLVHLYHESLSNNLKRFSYKGSIPTLKVIEDTMDRLTFFGLSFLVGFFPIMNTQTDNAIDFDKLIESKGEEGYNISIFGEDGIIEKFGEDVKALAKFQGS